ncbi:SPOR domain-containing protein [Tabrizicola sp.]|uniref:SPOR domain-containing protein n=1 Tax=Tabrizicola sp. TaxID=2005166 RepID=UPI003523CE68
MARARFRELALGVAATALLAGCVEGEGPFAASPSTGETAAPAASFARGKAQDIEAPEIFQVTETALWDGRPSLGGVWVASPDATDPERVIMRNPENGKSVVGALFRRERDNPGPKLQISSDAAEALGLLAGQPAQINVTALRRAEVAAPQPAAAPAAEPTDDAATSADAGAATDATAVAAAALAAVDAPANDDAAEVPQVGTEAATETATETATESAAGSAPVAEPAKKTWRERRAEAKAKRQAARAAKAAAAAGAAGEAAASAAIVSDIETVPLDGTSPAANPDSANPDSANPDSANSGSANPDSANPEPAGAEPSPPTRATIGSAVGASAQQQPSADAPEAAPAAATEADRPIQIGFFSEQENADRAVAALAKVGVPATARKEESNGKAYWTVTARGDAATLGKAKAAGFADAYFLK